MKWVLKGTRGIKPVFRSYLAGRSELQRSQSALQVWDIGLEFIESGCDVLLKLGWVGSRWARWSDLVESWTRHDCDRPKINFNR